ncbi:amino acid adenylation domain-containing protein, partial [Chryseobacterium sp. JV558]|uniref:amino acid adenylation domain-containing protein n=1 Tax=Chryseobacterium sp. JV558 TaxID=2663236 RepID=UPI00299E5ED8
GDLGRWNYQGYVEFMGRNDDQVKIRGYRIELDDVVLGLLSHDKINNAVVIAYGDTEGSRELIGYYTSDDFINVRELRSYLSERLPSYMIPGYYSQLDELPLTSNGKVDRKALALISHLELDTGTEYKAPVTTAEKILVEIWSEVLSIPQEKIGVNDNFFDLGGDSIKIIRLISPIKKQFSKKIEVVNFYKNPTISGLSILINAKDLILEESENLVLSLIEKKLEDLNTEVFLIEKHENAIGMKVLPMSDIQLGMVATSELMREEGEKGIYHDQMVLELGPVNLDIMTQALRLLIAKHEILRTSFNLYDYSIPVQFIHDTVKVTIHDNDISTLPPDEQKEYIYKFLKEERENNPFQMDLPSLFRLHIIKIAEKKNVLVFQFHHAILDGWSDKNFRVELLNTYSQLEKDLNYELLPLSVGLKDSIVSDFIESKNQHHIAYWKEELADYKRLDILSNEVHYDQLEYVYSIPFYNTLLEQCKSDKISLKTLFFAGYLYILKMLSVSNDITIGLVSNRRPIEEDGDKLLGCFLNTVPFRLQLESDIMQTLRTFLKYVDTKLEKLKGRDRFSLVEISKLHLEHYHANPFFDVLYNYVDFHNISDKFENSENANSNNLALESFDKTNTYLDFAVSVTSNVLSVSLTQGRFLRSGQTLDDLKIYLDNFLKAYINSPESQLTNEILISVEDRKELLETFNDTKVSYPEGESVVSLFEKQAAATPGHRALVFEGSQLTYQELNEKSNQLAYYLTSLGVTKETLVPICFERSTELIIGILAILKAGGAYVPVDPNYPESRIETILEDCSATIILTQQKQKSGLLSGQKVRAIALDTEQALWENASKLPLGQEITEDQLAYVIYTSGTTGKPKGVMIEHGNLYNFLKSIESSIFKDISVRLLNITSSTFDISLLEYFIPLILGGELILIKDEDLEDANQLVSKIDEYKPNVIQCTPSRWQILKEVDWSCDFDLKILCGGEYLSKDLKAYLLKNSTGCWNLYGPTETTIWSTITAIEDGVNSIGKPIANTDVYILDPELKLVPKGVVGELYIGGKGLSRGYLNRPELTKEKFIAHPFKEGEGLYKTGDLAKWLPEEGIEFIGRKDDQVKIRGYRIELGEIASQLDTVEGIRQSVVLALGSGGSERQLVAYYVSDQAFDIEELKNHLKITLPEYMIPKIYMHMECFALMVNGKIDRKALPMPDAAAYQKKQYAAPQTPMEKILVEIWQELLDIEQIGIHDNFFDLGGNSLLVIRLKAIIVKRFNLDLNVSVIFKLNDVKNIAEYLGLLIDKQEVVDDDNEKDVLFF